MVLGSSSVQALVTVGSKLRWVALFALAAVALALAYRERREAVGRPLLAVGVLGVWFMALALVSTAWSVDPRLTFERAVSFAVMLTAAGGLALTARARPGLPAALLYGILAASVAAALAGAVMVVLAHGDAVQAATVQSPSRLRGLGENPDTVSMLLGFAMPISLWALLRARSLRGRLLALATVVLLLGSISASGSRGALLAAWRILRCNPLSHGGFDPVPDRFTLRVGPVDPGEYHRRHGAHT